MAARILGLVLAGGRSTRMGRDKALLPWRGRPLALHVASRLARQTDEVALSGGSSPERLADLGLPVLPDDTADLGPLAGLVAGLRHARSNGFDLMLTAPCDAPFVPLDLATRLIGAIGDAPAALPIGRRGREPLFSLWRISALEPLEAALKAEQLGVLAALTALGAVEVAQDWAHHAAGEADPFANLNAPADLAAHGDKGQDHLPDTTDQRLRDRSGA